MDYDFLYEKKKKKEDVQIPLYQEIDIPRYYEEEKKKEEPKEYETIIIEL